VSTRQFKRPSEARCQQFRLAVVSAAPHGADGVDDVARGKPIALGDLCVARVATAEKPTRIAVSVRMSGG
jgi:hypothetical protein